MRCHPRVLRILFSSKERLEAGKIRSVIDSRCPWEQIAEAHRCVETRHRKGDVVITVTHIRKT